MPRRTIADDLREISHYLPDEVSTRLGQVVSSTYRRQWEQMGSPGNDFVSFYMQNPGAFSDVRQFRLHDVAPQFANYQGQLFGAAGDSPEMAARTARFNAAYGKTASQLRDPNTTIRDVQNILAGVAVPGLTSQATVRLTGQGVTPGVPQKIADTVYGAYTNIVSNVPTFSSEKGGFLSYALGNEGMDAVYKERGQDFAKEWEGSSLDIIGEFLNTPASEDIDKLNVGIDYDPQGNIVFRAFTGRDVMEGDRGRFVSMDPLQVSAALDRDEDYSRARSQFQENYGLQQIYQGTPVPPQMAGSPDAVAENRAQMARQAAMFMGAAPKHIPAPLWWTNGQLGLTRGRNINQLVLRPEQMLEIAGFSDISPQTARALYQMDQGVPEGAQRPSAVLESYAHEAIDALSAYGFAGEDRTYNAIQRDEMLGKNDEAGMDFNEKHGEWHKSFISPEEYKFSTDVFGSIPYVPVKNGDKIAGYRRIGSGLEDEVVDRSIGRGKLLRNDDIRIENNPGERWKGPFAEEVVQGMQLGSGDPGYAEYLAGVSAAQQGGRIAGYEAGISDPATAAIYGRVKGMGYKFTEGLETNVAELTGAKAYGEMGARLSAIQARAQQIYGAGGPSMRMATQAEIASHNKFVAYANHERGEVVVSSHFLDDAFIQSRYVDTGLSASVDDARMMAYGHELGHLRTPGRQGLLKKIAAKLESMPGPRKARVWEEMKQRLQNASEYSRTEQRAREVLADLEPHRRGLGHSALSSILFSEEELSEFAAEIDDQEFAPGGSTGEEHMPLNNADGGPGAPPPQGPPPPPPEEPPDDEEEKRRRLAAMQSRAAAAALNVTGGTVGPRTPHQAGGRSLFGSKFTTVDMQNIAASATRAVMSVNNSFVGQKQFLDENGQVIGPEFDEVQTRMGFARNSASGRTANIAGVRWMDAATGNINISRAQSEEMSGALSSAWLGISEMSEGDDPKAYMLTAQQRITKRINEWVRGYVDKAVEAFGDDPQTVQGIKDDANRLQKAMLNASSTMVSQMEAELGAGGADTRGWRDIGTQQILGARKIQDLAELRPGFKQKILERFGDYATAARAEPTAIEDDGNYYMVGDDIWGRAGGSGGNAGGGRFGGKWGGGPGQLLYNAYLMKRMFAMTIAPSIQGAEYYGEKITEPGAMGAGVPLDTSAEGVATRASLARDMWSRGTYEQFGGFSNASYMMAATFPGASRAASGIGMGLGIMAGGGMLAQMGEMGPMMGMTKGASALLKAAGPAGLVIGGGIALETLGMEAINAVHPGEEKVTWGSRAEDLTSKFALYQATVKAGGLIGGGLAAIGDLAGMSISQYDAMNLPALGAKLALKGMGTAVRSASAFPTEEEIMAEMSPDQQAAYEASLAKESPEAKAITSLAHRVKMTTGEEATEITPGLRSIQASMGSILGSEDKLQRLIETRYAQGGLGGKETLAELSQVAQQLGYGYGETGTLLDQLDSIIANGGGEREIRQLNRRAGQVARYSGSVSGYYRDPIDATKLIDQYNITTQPEAAGLQSLMEAAGQFGVEGSDVIGYKTGKIAGVAGSGITPVTAGDKLAELSKQYGPYRAQMAGQLSQQLQSMGGDWQTASGALGAFGIKDQPQLQATMGWLQTAQMFGSTVDPTGIGYSSQMQKPWQTQALGGVAQQLAVLGNVDYGLAAQAMGGLGLTNQQVNLFGRMTQGDLGAWSYNSYQQGSYYGRFQNMAGAPIYTTSGRDFLRMAQAQGAGGNPYAPNLSGGTDLNQMTNFLGTGDTEAARNWLDEGSIGRTRLNMSRGWDNTMKGIGLQAQSIALNWDYTQKQWGFQDAQRDLQYTSQQANFAAAEKRMGMQNDFAIRQEDLSWRRMSLGQSFAARQEDMAWNRMNISNDYAIRGEKLQLQQMELGQEFAERAEGLSWKRIELSEKYGGKAAQIGRERLQMQHTNQLWNLQFSYGTEQMQRGWAQEDWGYEDQTRALQFGWSMEDVNENIRYATGRQRRQLIKQRDRMAMTHSMEEGQIETGRERQEELWAREDERYKNQEEFLNKIIALDKDQYELAEKQRQEAIALDKEEWALGKERRIENYKIDKEQYDLNVERREELFKLDKDQWEFGREQREAMYKLDVEQWELNQEQRIAYYDLEKSELTRRKTEFEANWKIEEERIGVEREHQLFMHGQELLSLGLQKDIATEAKNYQLEMEKVGTTYQNIAGWAKTMMDNDPTMILQAMNQLGITMKNLPQTTITSLYGVFLAINNMDPNRLSDLYEILVTMQP